METKKYEHDTKFGFYIKKRIFWEELITYFPFNLILVSDMACRKNVSMYVQWSQ
jgi:hypothetical protein